ncbi:unnamed protein product [Closterium sp. NIES-54]
MRVYHQFTLPFPPSPPPPHLAITGSTLLPTQASSDLASQTIRNKNQRTAMSHPALVLLGLVVTGALVLSWLTRDAAARLAIRNHLPIAECTHFGQHKTAKALYDAVVARYSSPATAALGRLLLPYLFPELSAFATVQDLVTHIRTSDTRYRAALPADFLDRNPPPMTITLFFIVTRLPALDPTDLTVDLLEQHLHAAETSVVAVGADRGTPRTPFFEESPPSPLAPSYASAAAVDVLGAEDIGAASASGKHRSSKGKGGRSSGGGTGGGSGGGSGGGVGSGGGGSGGSGGGSGGFGGGGGGSGGSNGGGSGIGGSRDGAVQRGGSDGGQRSGVAIFDLDYDAIIVGMYALSASAEGDCYLCVPPDPGIEAAALGASESALPGTAPPEALHTFTLDSGASRYFFRDRTTLTPLFAPVPVRLADPLGGPVIGRSSIVLPCPADAMVTTTTLGGQRVSICTCTWTGRHLATFTHQPGSSLYTLATEPPQVAASAQVLQRFGFQFSSPQPTPLSTGHSLSAPPSDEFVEPSSPYPELVGCLMHRKVHRDATKRALRYLCSTSGMGLVLGGRGPVFLTGHADASWVDDSAMQRLSQGYTFSLGSGSVSWRSTCSTSVLSSSCEAEIYAGAMAAQELRWLTYLLTYLGEQPCSPPIMYVDNKAMIALCQEHRLEHRTKHIALQYFLAQELQHLGQFRLAYVATRANTADIFTKALPPGDHQRFSTVLGLVPTLPHLLTT